MLRAASVAGTQQDRLSGVSGVVMLEVAECHALCHPLPLARQELHVILLVSLGDSIGMPVGVAERTVTVVPRPVTVVIRVSQAETTFLSDQLVVRSSAMTRSSSCNRYEGKHRYTDC